MIPVTKRRFKLKMGSGTSAGVWKVGDKQMKENLEISVGSFVWNDDNTRLVQMPLPLSLTGIS